MIVVTFAWIASTILISGKSKCLSRMIHSAFSRCDTHSSLSWAQQFTLVETEAKWIYCLNLLNENCFASTYLRFQTMNWHTHERNRCIWFIQWFMMVRVRRNPHTKTRGNDAFRLTHLPLDKMGAFSQTIFSYTFSWIKRLLFWFNFHWSEFVRLQLTMI